jgi:hypothetical protein
MCQLIIVWLAWPQVGDIVDVLEGYAEELQGPSSSSSSMAVDDPMPPYSPSGRFGILARLLAAIARSLDSGARGGVGAAAAEAHAERTRRLHARLAALPILPVTPSAHTSGAAASGCVATRPEGQPALKVYLHPEEPAAAAQGGAQKQGARGRGPAAAQAATSRTAQGYNSGAGVGIGTSLPAALAACGLQLGGLGLVLLDPQFLRCLTSQVPDPSVALALLHGIGVQSLSASDIMQECVLPALQALATTARTAANGGDNTVTGVQPRGPLSPAQQGQALQAMRLLAFPLAAGLIKPPPAPGSVPAPPAGSHRDPNLLLVPRTIMPAPAETPAQQQLLQQLTEAAVLVMSDGSLVRAPASAAASNSSEASSNLYLPLVLGGVDISSFAPGFVLPTVHPAYVSCCPALDSSAWYWLLK